MGLQPRQQVCVEADGELPLCGRPCFRCLGEERLVERRNVRIVDPGILRPVNSRQAAFDRCFAHVPCLSPPRKSGQPPAQGACYHHYLSPFDGQVAGRWHGNETLHVGSEANNSRGSPLGLENPAPQFSVGYEGNEKIGRCQCRSVSTTAAFIDPDQSRYVLAIRAAPQGNRRCLLLRARSRRGVRRCAARPTPPSPGAAPRTTRTQ
jgi:hypothetical protein